MAITRLIPQVKKAAKSAGTKQWVKSATSPRIVAAGIKGVARDIQKNPRGLIGQVKRGAKAVALRAVGKAPTELEKTLARQKKYGPDVHKQKDRPYWWKYRGAPEHQTARQSFSQRQRAWESKIRSQAPVSLAQEAKKLKSKIPILRSKIPILRRKK